MPKSTNPLIHRRQSPASPFNKKKKPSITVPADSEERLPDTNLPPTLAPQASLQDVESLLHYIHAHTWTPLPSRAAGMNSERVSEILRFRAALPRIVSTAHLYAVSASSTATERELAGLVAGGRVRKVTVPGRGKGGAGVGEGVVLAEDWRGRVRGEEGLSEEVRGKYLDLLDSYPASATVVISSLKDEEVRMLVRAGFLTAPSAGLSSNLSNLFAPPGSSYFSTLSASGTKAASGTLAAVGGHGAVHESGGGGSTLNRSQPSTQNQHQHHHQQQRHMTLSLPTTGSYLKLLTSARQHLLSLLKQTSPRYREATLTLLQEKWDGNIANPGTSSKRGGDVVLPGRTKKWREFHGLEFEWVLAECVGAGLVEGFETGSVGVGFRGT